MNPSKQKQNNNKRLFKFGKNTAAREGHPLVKNVFLIIIALIFFAATLYAENTLLFKQPSVLQANTILRPANYDVSVTSNGAVKVLRTDYEIQQGDIIASSEDGDVEILLSGNGVIRLDKNTELQFWVLDNLNKSYDIQLIKGGVWVNASFDEYDIKIKTDYVYVKPEDASFSFVYDGANTKIYVASHDVYVGIVYNNEEINGFWLPDGNTATLQNAKITEKSETIKRLLYSKLIKEFNYGRLSAEAVKNDPWLASQIQKDQKYDESIRNFYINEIRSAGLNTISTSSVRYQFKSLVSDLENVLTLSEHKKIERLLDVLFENLYDAKYFFLQGNSIDGEIRLSIFREDIGTTKYISNDTFNKDLFVRLKNELRKGIFITPVDSMYPVKNEIENRMFAVNLSKYLDENQKFRLLALKLYDVSSSAAIDPGASLRVFVEYFDLYNKIMLSYRDSYNKISRHIERQNILVDNILSKYPRLYKVEIFENKKLMEAHYIASIAGDTDKKEQRQTFISNKIDLLSRIKFFLFDDSINAEEARRIVFLLIEDIENLKKDILDVAAVNNLFERRLSDFGVFWQYLNSAEYSTTPLHGRTHQERFESFKVIQRQQVSFQDVRDEILGGEPEVIAKPTVEEILAAAKNALNAADIQNVEFGYYNDPAQTRIPILQASVSGIPFRGTYDFERKLVSNIIVNDKLISGEGVRLENTKTFIVQAVSSAATVVQPPVQEPPVPAQDPQEALKNAARVFIAEKFTKTGIIISRENIDIIDFDAGEYFIKNVYYAEYKQAIFSFSYRSKDDKIYNLNIDTPTGVKAVTDTFSPAFLKAVVTKIYTEAGGS